MHSTFTFRANVAPEDSFPRTPPYTPNPTRRRFERSESPASIRSLHPTETVSPTKKADQIATPDDHVQMEELHEGDAGYASDADVIYPEEFEEPESDQDYRSDNTFSDEDNGSDNEISHHFSRLGCHDSSQEAKFARIQRAKYAKKCRDVRLFKRSHSQSVKTDDTEMSDADAMPDHDRISSARRLRRRVRGPGDATVAVDELAPSTPPPSRGFDATGLLIQPHVDGNPAHDEGTNSDDGMDVDEDSE